MSVKDVEIRVKARVCELAQLLGEVKMTYRDVRWALVQKYSEIEFSQCLLIGVLLS